MMVTGTDASNQPSIFVLSSFREHNWYTSMKQPDSSNRSNFKHHSTTLPTRHCSTLALAVSVALLSIGANVQAQSPSASDSPTATPAAAPLAVANATPPVQRLETVTVTGNPFANSNAGAAQSVLSGEALQQRQSGTLGETLSGLPGISSTYFGPNASRPVIRGQDSERIRVMENGASSFDAASLSYDHAVPIEPIAVERIEVLRGPSALLYGGSAIGGVVNAISNRIPKQRFADPSLGVSAQFGGAERAAVGAARIDTSAGPMSFHLDATRRTTDDLHVPEFVRPDGTRATRVVNSSLKASSGAVGASIVGRDGYVGIAIDGYRSTYGVVVEEDVIIKLKRDKLMLEGKQQLAAGPVRELTALFASTRYQHQEIEGTGEVGTTFKNRGDEWRIEAKTANYGPWRAVVGAQGERSSFSALGEEAFVPPSKTTSNAVFGMQQATFGAADVVLGGRIERSQVRSSEVVAEDGSLRFGAADKKSLTLGSAAIGVTQRMSSAVTINSNLAYSERAPSYFERYADGVHLATGAYELGDRNLPKEKSTQLDIGVAWQQGKHRAQITAFASRHQNFVSLDATGNTFSEVSEEGDTVEFPIYAFRAVPARFYGLEAESSWRVMDGATSLDITGKFDLVRAKNSLTAEPLPRIAPMRFTLGASYKIADWTLRGEVVRANRQSRIPEAERFLNESGDGATKASTVINLSLSKALKWDRWNGVAFIRVNNATDALAYNASSIRSIRELSPLPGRGVRAGIDLSF
jgi:iron complex outermembrane recepter protein